VACERVKPTYIILPPRVDPVAVDKYIISRQQPPELCSSYVPKRPARLEFRASRNCVNVSAVKCDRTYKAAQLTFELELTGTRSAAAWPPLRLCYSPAVFFLHVLLIARSNPQGTTWRTFQKSYISICIAFL